MSDAFIRSQPLMGTLVSMQVVGHGASARARRARAHHVDRAFDWFAHVEATCTRFDAASELRQLCMQTGVPTRVSPLLFEAVRFALAVAAETDGRFDPTVGHHMEARGFDREHRTGMVSRAGVDAPGDVSHRDIEFDAEALTITLHRPLLLDLGAVAKGLAIDMAARELAPLANFSVDAGGDLYLGGCNRDGDAWTVGVRHPRDAESLVARLRVSDRAVCTSGDYARRVNDTEHHIVDPTTGTSPTALASATVVAGSAMVADALATTAFVLGPEQGIALLERHEVEGCLVSPALDMVHTQGWPGV